nr:MAG: hypothetical protein 1 [Guangxi cystovirus 1]QYF49736.1 MAG: hypothetical protein 1 [Guangxi cystovirus 10]
MKINRSVSGVFFSDDSARLCSTAVRGVKTTGLLIIDGQCVGRFDSAGVTRGNHQLIITHDRSVFDSYIEAYAMKGTKVVLLNADGESEYCYRVGV